MYFNMYHLKLLIASLAIFTFADSLPVKSSDEKVDPIDLAYTCVDFAIDSTKSPILLLHGVGGSRSVWKRLGLLLAFRTGRKACAVDLRNHGDSPWNNRTDIEALAADIGNFLDKEGIKKVNIIGQSLGGKTAIHFTLKNPERVDSIIVEDMTPNTVYKEAVQLVTGMFQLMKTSLESIPEGKTLQEAREYIVKFLNEKLKEMGSTESIPDQFTELVEIKSVDGKWRFKFNIELLEESLKDLSSFWTPSTGKYEGPSLFIYGTKSQFQVYKDKDNILQLFPKAEFLPLEGAGHIIQGVFPEFDDAVIRFLNKLN